MTDDIEARDLSRLTAIAREALLAYDLEVASLRFLRKSDGVTFRVRTSDSAELVLRIHNNVDQFRGADYRDKQAIESSLTWLDALGRQTEIIVPEPVCNRSGEWVTAVSGESTGSTWCTVLRWIEGDVLPGNHTAQSAHAVGKLMGEMHRHASQWEIPDGFVRPRFDVDRFKHGLAELETFLGAQNLPADAAHILGEVVGRLEEVIAGLGSKPDSWGPIHCDLGWPQNVVYQGGLACPIDFNGCALGHYLCDIAWAFAYVPAALRSDFLAGYELVYSTVDEVALGAFQVGVGMMLFAGWCTNNPSQLNRLPTFLEGPCRRFLRGEPFQQ